MGPTSPAPLPVRAASGKALGEMSYGEAAFDAPGGGDRSQGLKDEVALREPAMRHVQVTRAESTTAPQHEVEIEDARTPAFPGAAAELALKLLELL